MGLKSRPYFRGIFFFLLILILGFSGTSFGDDRWPNRPSAEENNLWYEFNDSDTVFVFVHGIFSDSNSCWLYKDESSKADNQYWPDLLLNDSNFNHPSIFLGGYYTSVGSGKYNIRDAAKELYGALRRRISPGETSVLEKPKIIFIAHSTGGIVVRHLLVKHLEDFSDKTVGLVLMASPSVGSHDADRLDWLANFAENEMGKQLQWDNQFLDELDRDFKDLVDHRKIPGLVGKEAIENHFIVRWLWYFHKNVLVEKGSGARYFDDFTRLPNTDHFSAVKPNNRRHPAYTFVRDFYEHKFLKKEGASLPNKKFRLRFVVKSHPEIQDSGMFETLKPPRPLLEFVHVKPEWYGPKTVARQKIEHYEEDILLPPRGEKYMGKFTRTIEESFLNKKPINLTTTVCFQRTHKSPQASHVFLLCNEGDQCTVDERDLGVANNCKKDMSGLKVGYNFVSEAYAEEVLRKPQFFHRWFVPSLKTLQKKTKENQQGYTHFKIVSGPLPSLQPATHFTYSITVNDVSVLIDGWDQHYIRVPLRFKDGFSFNFALQNLDFSGKLAGNEKITLNFKFYAQEKFLKEFTLMRNYIALRDATEKTFQVENLGKFTWTGTYNQPIKPDKFEVFLKSAQTVNSLLAFKEQVDAKQLTFNSKPIVAVIRPPLPPNVFYGVVLGVKLKTGQTKFTFDKITATNICQWLTENRKRPELRSLIRQDVYRFELEPRAPGTPKFRFCKTL